MDPSALYLLPPEDFTAARDAAAKQARADGDAAGATALKALRRPSVAAHLVNLLVDRELELLAQLLELGPALASAQAVGSGDALRELGAQRRQLVDAVTARAAELARREVSSAVREEVAATLEAALADLASANAVRSGRLVRALSYAGLGDVDLEGAVAAAPARGEHAGEPEAPDTAAAERAALDAAGALDDAVRACRTAEREREDADRAAAETDEEVARLRRQLSDAEQAAGAAHEEQDRRAAAAEEAVQVVRRAQQQEEQARTELDRLRRLDGPKA